MKVCRWLFLCFFSVSINAATLVPSPGVSILYINGSVADSKIGKNTLQPGESQIIVRMDKDLGKGSSSQVFTSDPFVLDLKVTGDLIKLNHPVARSFKEAEKAFKSGEPQWRITQDGATVNYSQEALPKKEGLFPFLGLDKVVKKYNEDKGIYFSDGRISAAPVAATTTAAVVATSSSNTALNVVDSKQIETPNLTIEDTTNLDQLKAWYQKASKSERKEFRRWMIDQE